MTSSNALAQMYRRAGVYVEDGAANAMWAGRPQLKEGFSVESLFTPDSKDSRQQAKAQAAGEGAGAGTPHSLSDDDSDNTEEDEDGSDKDDDDAGNGYTRKCARKATAFQRGSVQGESEEEEEELAEKDETNSEEEAPCRKQRTKAWAKAEMLTEKAVKAVEAAKAVKKAVAEKVVVEKGEMKEVFFLGLDSLHHTHTLFSYTTLIHDSNILCSYITLIHYTYTILIHCICTLDCRSSA